MHKANRNKSAYYGNANNINQIYYVHCFWGSSWNCNWK